jgi:dihydropyrimidinase
MPAKINGLEKKGSLGVGFDADVVIFNPDYEGVITAANNLEDVDYCPFEGFAQKGRAETVFLRGQKIVRDGMYIGEKGQGRFVPGKPFGHAYSGLKKDAE